MVIGICGGSGSGKTTLLKRLATTFEQFKPSVFSMDNYYRPYKEQARDKNNIVNFDLPSALDQKKLENDLQQLVGGKSIEVLEYQFNADDKKHVLITIPPSDLIIVEGLFVFAYEKVRKSLNYSIFVDVDPKIQLDRRIYRDLEMRGYTREDILYQWENHVIPCFENYLLPYKNKADFIYRNDKHAEADYIQLVENLNELFG